MSDFVYYFILWRLKPYIKNFKLKLKTWTSVTVMHITSRFEYALEWGQVSTLSLDSKWPQAQSAALWFETPVVMLAYS